MASEYLKWKYRDVKPDPPPRERTPKEKFINWWYYNWGIVAICAIVVGVLASIIWDVLGIGKTKPDYIVAIVGQYSLPDDTVNALSEQLGTLGVDGNGDGKVYVEVRQYPTGPRDEDGNLQPNEMNYADNVKMIADINDGESYFFLVQEPEYFQLGYEILAKPDGSRPEDGDTDITGCVAKWTDCPVLAGLDLGEFHVSEAGLEASGVNQDLLKDYYVGRRAFVDGVKHNADLEACDALWAVLMEGAKFV